MANTFKIIFITDIHLNFQNVQKFRKWHQQNQIKFDICLIGGDTANCDQNNHTHNQQQQENLSNKILIQIQQILSCKVILIPGNHDPLSYYSSQYQISPQIQNCHSRKLLLAQGLQLFGFGGSVPGYSDKNRTQQVWKGYPYNSNDELVKAFQQKPIFKEDKNQNKKIFLTHCGPFDYQTSIDRRNINQPIYGGAVYYNSLVKHQNLLLYLHGHVHNGSRFSKANQIPIINPGGLIFGQFAYICLQKQQNQGRWVYQSSHFIKLPQKNKI